MNNLKPFEKGVRFFVYDDSLNVVAYVSDQDKLIAPIFRPEQLKEYLYIKYFIEKKPDYIFEKIIHQLPVHTSSAFFSYKDGKIELIYLEYGAKELTITSLSELDDIRVLNPYRL